MNGVHNEQYDTLHAHFFNSIYQKLNNEKMTLPINIVLTLFHDDK